MTLQAEDMRQPASSTLAMDGTAIGGAQGPEQGRADEVALQQSAWHHVPDDVLLQCFLLLLNSRDGLRQARLRPARPSGQCNSIRELGLPARRLSSEIETNLCDSVKCRLHNCPHSWVLRHSMVAEAASDAVALPCRSSMSLQSTPLGRWRACKWSQPPGAAGACPELARKAAQRLPRPGISAAGSRCSDCHGSNSLTPECPQVRNCSIVCKLWRQVAEEAILNDTAASRPRR